MKYLSVLIVLVLSACQTTPKTDESVEAYLSSLLLTKMDYNKALADSVGADKYGMKKYVIAFLKRGPNRSKNEEEAAALQRKHMDNINRLAEEGKLVLAGPFFGDGDLRGIYVFDVESIEEARVLTETDPAIQKGSLEMELHEWYGSAATVFIKNLHSAVAEIEI